MTRLVLKLWLCTFIAQWATKGLGRAAVPPLLLQNLEFEWMSNVLSYSYDQRENGLWFLGT